MCEYGWMRICDVERGRGVFVTPCRPHAGWAGRRPPKDKGGRRPRGPISPRTRRRRRAQTVAVETRTGEKWTADGGQLLIKGGRPTCSGSMAARWTGPFATGCASAFHWPLPLLA